MNSSLELKAHPYIATEKWTCLCLRMTKMLCILSITMCVCGSFGNSKRKKLFSFFIYYTCDNYDLGAIDENVICICGHIVAGCALR